MLAEPAFQECIRNTHIAYIFILSHHIPITGWLVNFNGGPGFYLAVRNAVAERITLGLAEGCVQADLASSRLQNPMLGGE